jgi:hypothetical protein
MHAYISPIYFAAPVHDVAAAASCLKAALSIQGSGLMRLSVVIEIVDGECHLPQAANNVSSRYSGPLGTFIAQVAAPYLRIPGASASENCAQIKADSDRRSSSRKNGKKLDRPA